MSQSKQRHKLISNELVRYYNDFIAQGTDGDTSVVSFEDWLSTLEVIYNDGEPDE